MKQLLPREYVDSAHLGTAVVLEFDSQKTSIFLKVLAKETYLNDQQLTHLRRIRKSPKDAQKIQFLFRLKEHFDDEAQLLIPAELQPYELLYIEVPLNNPKTKEQFAQFSAYWPCTFKVQSLEMPSFSADETTILQALMEKVRDLAVDTYKKGHHLNACLLYDPVKKQLLMTAQDLTQRKQKSICHCVMNLMDKFGSNFIVTAQQKNQSAVASETGKEEEEVKKGADLKGEIIDDSTQKPQIMESQQQVVDRTLSEQETPKEHTSSAETKDLNKKRKAEESLESTLTSYYYCTGLDLIIFEEPCIMCSMALIHSRIRRVFYSVKNQLHQGGLNSQLMINHMPTLNHQFLVFQAINIPEISQIIA